MSGIELRLAGLSDTQALAEQLAPLLRAGDVIALEGGLGAGKTSFARALISALLGAPTEVPSPTYTLVQAYDGPAFPIWHFDLYRLDDPADLTEIGWDDTFGGLALVEWPGRAGTRLPKHRLQISIEITPDARIARLEPFGEDWQRRLHGLRF